MLETRLFALIEKALKDLRYGSVQLVVHNGQLVRIERVERIRLPSEITREEELTGRSGSHMTLSSG